jgi:LEA14-like dessication related protein
MKILFSLSIIILLVSSCKRPQGFDYRDVKNISLEKLGFDSTTLKMDLVYFNPNNFGVVLKNVDCEIYVDKKYLGHYSLDTIMKIEKKSEFALPSTIKISMKNVYKNALNLLFNKEVELNVKGSTKVSKMGITISVPFDYTSMHQFNL